MVGSTRSAAATVWLVKSCPHIQISHRKRNNPPVTHDPRRATTSAGLKFPASAKRARMESTVSRDCPLSIVAMSLRNRYRTERLGYSQVGSRGSG